MALSNGSGTNNSGPLVFLSARSKIKGSDGKDVELAKPYFEISRVNDEGQIVKTDETATRVEGDLVAIKLKVREYNGKKTPHVVLYVQDNNPEAEKKETYSLDLTHRISTRSLFNAILSLESPKNIAISIYKSKKGYESFGLDQDGEKVKWKYEIADLPAAEVIKDKRGEVIKTDHSDVDAFFETELKVLAEKFGFNTGNKSDNKPATDETPTPAATPAAKPAAKSTGKPAAKAAAKPEPEQNDDDSVPF
jgi:hypothetical protein